jgi:hypothetical protein
MDQQELAKAQLLMPSFGFCMEQLRRRALSKQSDLEPRRKVVRKIELEVHIADPQMLRKS